MIAYKILTEYLWKFQSYIALWGMLLTCPNCHHTFVAAEDAALQRELRYLYEWLFEKCEGKTACDTVDNIVPEWWYHVSDDTKCQTNTTIGLKYFNGILVARRCKGMLRYPLQIIYYL